jgi:hypothetical protein
MWRRWLQWGRRIFFLQPYDQLCFGELLSELDLYEPDIYLHGNRAGNWELQFRSLLVGNGWGDHIDRCFYSLCGGKRNHYCDIDRRFNQIGFSNSSGDCGPNDHFGLSSLLPDIHPNHSNIRLHRNFAGNRELQFCGHVVCQPD